MVGIDKAVTLLQVEYLINLTSEDQTVATKDGLVIGYR